MDGSAVSAGPWLVLGAVVGVLLALVVALTLVPSRRRRPALPPPPDAPPGGWVVDDLPGWLDDPTGARDDSGAAAPPLLAQPVPGTAGTAAENDDARGTLLALSVAALLLVAAAAVVAAAGADDHSSAPAGQATGSPPVEPAAPAAHPPTAPADPEPGDPGAGQLAEATVPVGSAGARADLAFEGVVLERRAVGVTAAYPTLTLTAAGLPGGPAVAHLELPTFNCLTDAAPADPVAAGCLRTPVEFADLPSPALTVERVGDGLRISGRFPTYLRPNGSGPEWTGRVYPVTVTVSPGGTEGTAEGVLEIGDERAAVSPESGPGSLRLPG